MLQFAAPLGLLGLAAVVAPILVHLVRRPTRVVRLGSLRFLEHAPHRLRSWRWREWRRLALRCALLAALALSLAGPEWRPAHPYPARWALLVPGTPLAGDALAEWNRLRGEGYEARLLAAGFPPSSNDPVTPSPEVDAWSLLRELDVLLAPGSRAVVFGPTRATLFRGDRPTLSRLETTWRAVAADPSPLEVRPPTRVGLVATPDRAPDARVLRAAFAALGVDILTNGAPGWVFQLGAAALPPGWEEAARRGGCLVTDAPDSAEPSDVSRTFDAGSDRIRLHRRVAPGPGAVIGRDSMGEPWLTEEPLGTGRHWSLALRFHPDWTDWPLGAALPAWWGSAFHLETRLTADIAPEQAAPGFDPDRTASAPTPDPARIDLRGLFWGLAAGFFLMDRLLAGTDRRRRAAP